MLSLSQGHARTKGGRGGGGDIPHSVMRQKIRTVWFLGDETKDTICVVSWS